MFRVIAPLALLIASPAAAQEGAWRVSDGRATLTAAKVGISTTLPGVTLTQTGEFSNKGKGIDNFAQFKSADGQVFVTAYVYRTAFPDAALAAHATDRAIRTRFGADVRLASESVVALGDRPGAAIRMVYEGGGLNGAPTVTAGAFARAGDWLVKIRASGPAARSAEVAAALDALIAGTRVAPEVTVPTVAPLSITGPCPPADAKRAKPVRSKDPTADVLLGGVLAGAIAARPDAPPAFPANGATPACVRGVVGSGETALSLLQPAGEPSPQRLVVPLNDAGTVLSVEPAPIARGYVIKTYTIGAVETRGTLDRLPTAEQITGWLGGRDAEPLRLRSRTILGEDGRTTVELDAGALRRP